MGCISTEFYGVFSQHLKFSLNDWVSGLCSDKQEREQNLSQLSPWLKSLTLCPGKVQRPLAPAWLSMATHGVPSPYQITDLSKEVFTLKEALKVQQSTPTSSKEEEEALRGQVTALQQQIQVLAL